jgi:RNA polymerase sigma-70 factor (ECF subfamily)
MDNARQGRMEDGNAGSEATRERSRVLSDEFRHSYGWLKARLWRKVGCQHLAEDLSSEAFVQLSATNDILSVREPRALLTTIAQRLVFDFWRRRDLENAYLAELARAPSLSVQSEEEKYEMVQALAEIDKKLAGLPPRVKLAFLYSQVDGMTYAEIAGKLGVSTSMVGQYMTKALAHCMGLQLS